MGEYSFRNRGCGRLHVGFPYPDDGVAGFRKISVLTAINGHTPALPTVWIGKPFWMAMPVVAVELDNKAEGRDMCVNAEFVEEKRLLVVLDADGVEDCVSSLFQFVEVSSHLVDIHLNEPVSPCWVCVAASGSAVCWLCVPLAGRGPLELAPASLARVYILVSTLPLYLVSERAKEVCGFFKLTCLDVDRLSAEVALALLTGFSLWPWTTPIALERTILLTFAHVVSDHLAALNALNGAHFVPELAFGQTRSLQLHEVYSVNL